MSYSERNGSVADRAAIVVDAISGDSPPMAAADLAALFSVSRGAFDRTMNLLRVDTDRRIYIAAYRRPSKGRGGGTWIPLYKAGNQPDVPVPRRTAEEEQERRRDISRRQSEIKAAQRQRERADLAPKPEIKPTLDPFSLALFGRAA